MVLSALVDPQESSGMRPLSARSRFALSLASLGLGLLAWALLSVGVGRPELIPSPLAVGEAFLEMLASGEIWRAVAKSLWRVGIGYCLGVAAGIATGLVLGAFRLADVTVGPVFEFLKGIPPIALVPLFVMWMGIGELSKVSVIAYLVWIIVAISTAVGAREIPRIRLRTGATLGLTGFQTFRWVILPSTVPYILSGMRSALGFAFVALVSAELVAASSGIGQIILDARFSLQTARMVVGLLILGTLGAVTHALFDRFTSRLGLAYQRVH
jgi:ABC-type nitrate/sulfonate/bicarbonate transport system permease component